MKKCSILFPFPTSNSYVPWNICHIDSDFYQTRKAVGTGNGLGFHHQNQDSSKWRRKHTEARKHGAEDLIYFLLPRQEGKWNGTDSATTVWQPVEKCNSEWNAINVGHWSKKWTRERESERGTLSNRRPFQDNVDGRLFLVEKENEKLKWWNQDKICRILRPVWGTAPIHSLPGKLYTVNENGKSTPKRHEAWYSVIYRCLRCKYSNREISHVFQG